jgi:L-seryl-tRNA(Ser) seleniumtransferase
MQDPRRAVPRTDTVLADPALAEAVATLGRDRVRAAARTALESCRNGAVSPLQVVDEIQRLLLRGPTQLSRVINATGVVVHTNLGRAPLSAAAVEAMATAAGPTDVELDLRTGRRGPRGHQALAALAAAVPVAEDVHVVNNGAAAVALAASALATDRHIVIARGELVEIGDGFRIPELIESTGARIREVGTTNRVRLADYAEAIDDETALVLKAHPSNFVVSGFTSSVPVGELASLSVPVVVDIGSGLLRPDPRLPDEPDATSVLTAGAALVSASGDKLLGGPQCGLVLGRRSLVHRLRRHPLARAMRVDKITLAALEATLTCPPSPVHQMLATDPGALAARADQLAAALAGDVDVSTVSTTAAVGGGGAPGVELASAGLSLPPSLAEPLRLGDPPLLGHVEGGRLVLDLMAVPADLDPVVLSCIRRAAGVG